MPQNKQREHKCSHHTAAAGGSRWHNFHFSGKVIMCSVLFGLGLVLIGGIVMAIGMDRDDGSKSETVNEIQNKAPMSIVGPVILGIGGFTVIVGIIMCLFETNICRKRQPDSRPLIEEQGANSAGNSTNSAAVPSTAQVRDKHRHHKKSSSPRKHKGTPKRSSAENKIMSGNPSSCASPSSKPIDMQRSSSRDFTASDKFLTPPSSFMNENVPLKPNFCDAENQTSTSLLKSFTSSGKSWTTSTEFQTPSSSLRDSSGSFEERKKNIEIPSPLSNLEDPSAQQLDDSKHEFLSPKSSNAEILDDEPESIENSPIVNSNNSLKLSDDDSSGSSLDEPIKKNLDLLQHEFITPKSSYVNEVKMDKEIDKTFDNSSVSTLTNSQSQDDIEENITQVISAVTPNESDEIKIENVTINNKDSIGNMNGVPQFTTTGDASLPSELNSCDPMKDNLIEVSELSLKQHPTNSASEISDNIPAKVVTSQEINVSVQESNDHTSEDKNESDIKVDLKDSSSNDTHLSD